VQSTVATLTESTAANSSLRLSQVGARRLQWPHHLQLTKVRTKSDDASALTQGRNGLALVQRSIDKQLCQIDLARTTHGAKNLTNQVLPSASQGGCPVAIGLLTAVSTFREFRSSHHKSDFSPILQYGSTTDTYSYTSPPYLLSNVDDEASYGWEIRFFMAHR
jgi:hypothetical protein